MMAFIPPRLRKPLWNALAGAAFAAAWLVRGGPTWWISIMTVVVVAVRVITMYVRGGQDSDEGALAGSRADERQKMLSLRSRALGWNIAMIAAFIGLTSAVAVKATWWWPFVVILAVASLGYLFGLSSYGSDESDADDDADAGQPARSPVQR
jgi:hypothetical protein